MKRSLVVLSAVILLGVRLSAQDVVQQAYLKASNTEAGDEFGGAMAMSGDTLVIAARREDSDADGVNGDESDNSLATSGAVYVFVRSGSTWSQQAYLKSSNSDTFDNFGGSLALAGDTLVVGAVSEDSAATGVNGDDTDNSLLHSGAAYVFVRNGTTWSQQAYLKASNAGETDAFGQSVAAWGDTVLVGAPLERSAATGINGDASDDSALKAGAAYVFTRSGTTWSQQAYLKASNTDAGDFFGWSVALSGDTAVVGAHFEASAATGVNGDESDDNVAIAGAAYVYSRSGTTWSQQAYLKASNTGDGDQFGFPLAISAETLVVGAVGENSNATGVNGDELNNTVFNAGAAYVFVRAGATWSQQAYLKASNTETSLLGDAFGSSLSLAGDVLVVGAPEEDSEAVGVDGDGRDDSLESAGSAYVFVRDGAAWSQLAYLKASNTDELDGFGSAVTVSADSVAIGARSEQSAATGVNGDQADDSASAAGAAYVFDLDLDPWSDEGCALAGTSGAAALTGSGSLAAGSRNAVTLSSAAPSAFMGVFIGLGSTPTPFKGGTLKPVPWAKLLFTNTDTEGSLSLPFGMPAGVPSLTELWLQAAIQDAGAPLDVALSNALLGVVP